ncbi:hypothetical protein [Sphingobacterium mizutaii]|uniref:hypothetical protein n=1 Tax=Sphingobacterium mizutaii TaxID=1010 RepID=UPI001628B2C8|nr:hypothetical protein [Sphingobacterium mizutaii]
MNKISFLDTHIYPGCLTMFTFRISLKDTLIAAIAEFSDGSVTDAEIETFNAEQVAVFTDSYSTARGTHISKKGWMLNYDAWDDIWKVIKRI